MPRWGNSHFGYHLLQDQPYLHILQTGRLPSLRYRCHPLLPADPYNDYNHNHDNSQTHNDHNDHNNNNPKANNDNPSAANNDNRSANHNNRRRLDQRAAASTIWRIATRQRPTAPWTKL
jgi:CRISPR/Cas system-associated endonuclease/helicase Cas3